MVHNFYHSRYLLQTYLVWCSPGGVNFSGDEDSATSINSLHAAQPSWFKVYDFEAATMDTEEMDLVEDSPSTALTATPAAGYWHISNDNDNNEEKDQEDSKDSKNNDLDDRNSESGEWDY